MSALPSGWVSASLNDIIAADGVFCDGDWVESKDQDPHGSIRLLQLADVGDGRFLDKSSRFINDRKFDELRCTEVLAGDILVARMPDPLGRACFVPELAQRCITVVDVAIIRPGSDSVHPRWLMHSINAPEIRLSIELQSSGTTRRRISRSKLGAVELPLPPRDEQERIAGKLDTLLARVDACRTRVDRVPRLLRRFRQAVMAAATSGELTADWREEQHAADWISVRLEDAASDFSYGSSAKSARVGDVPVLRMGNIQDGQLDWGDLVYSSDPGEISRYALDTGDVLFNRTNSPELVGKTAVFRGERKAIFAGYLIRIRCSDKLHPEYLSYCLNSPTGREYCWRVKSDGVSQSNINARKLAAFPFGLPSIEEQYEIVRRVQALFVFADRLEAHYTAAHRQLEQLTPELLDRAFRGQLVPQDPSDEPVTVLLERIRAARAAVPARLGQRKVGRKAQMARISPDHVRELLHTLPQDGFTFDELRKHVATDYEAMKDIVFALLGEETPCLRQVFDPEIQAMRFVRVAP